MNAVLQINVWIPLDKQLINNDKLFNFLSRSLRSKDVPKKANVITDTRVPISIVCYGRRVVGKTCDMYYHLRQLSLTKRFLLGQEVTLINNILSRIILDVHSSRFLINSIETSGHINGKVVMQAKDDFDKRQNALMVLLEGNPSGYESLCFEHGISKESLSEYQRRMDHYSWMRNRLINCTNEDELHVMKKEWSRFTKKIYRFRYKFFKARSHAYCASAGLLSPHTVHETDSLRFVETLGDLLYLVESYSTMFGLGGKANFLKNDLCNYSLGRHLEQLVEHKHKITMKDQNSTNHCMYNPLPDPNTTYNGPVIQLKPSWDKLVSSMYRHLLFMLLSILLTFRHPITF